MTEFYSPNNLKVIFPFLSWPTLYPKHLVLGGVAGAREAQTASETWPGIKIVGVEPNPEAVKWQREKGGWRDEWVLLDNALTDQDNLSIKMMYTPGQIQNASIDPEAVEGSPDNPFRIVQSITLDSLDQTYGPFEDAIVWLDIEGSELLALRGATKLLASRRVWLWNLEMLSRVPGMMTEVPQIMTAHGYRAVAEWNDSETCRDRIFLRSDLADANYLCQFPQTYKRPKDVFPLRML